MCGELNGRKNWRCGGRGNGVARVKPGFRIKRGMTPGTGPGAKRGSWANLAHSAPLRTCFGWGVRKRISDLRLGPSTRLRLAQDDAGRQFKIG